MTQHEIPTGRRRWRRAVTAAAVATAALAAPVLTAAPASAAAQTTIHPEWIDGCGGCPGPLLSVQSLLDRRAAGAVTASVSQGLSGLIAASRATDPAAARRLHDVAIRTLAGGAAQAGNAAWSAGDWDGDLCPRRPWPFPGPGPHWAETQQWLADGLTMLSRANISGDARLLADAGRQLDAGAVGLTDFQGCV